MSFISVWADGFAIKLWLVEAPDARELSWLFDKLKTAYGR